MSFTYDFLSYDDLLIVALVAFGLVLANLWDFIRYGYEHRGSSPEPVELSAHPLQAIVGVASRALAAARFPHADRISQRPMLRRRPIPRAQRHGHRPVPARV